MVTTWPWLGISLDYTWQTSEFGPGQPDGFQELQTGSQRWAHVKEGRRQSDVSNIRASSPLGFASVFYNDIYGPPTLCKSAASLRH